MVLVLVVVLAARPAAGQTLSEIVLPSEDEIVEALKCGEIGYDQFLILQELIAVGIDSSSLYLLDEIPNLLFVAGRNPLLDRLEADQAGRVVTANRPQTGSRGLTGSWEHRFSQALEETEESWYKSNMDLQWRNRYRFRAQVDRTESGYERVTRRAVSYQNRYGVVRRIELGSFDTRLGLGTSFGYRGKLLDFDRHISSESWAFPDYGGYNGVMVDLGIGKLSTRVMGSLNRDADYRLTSLALSGEYDIGRIRPLVVFGFNRLTERQTADHIDLFPIAAGGRYEYERGNVAAEFTRQFGNRAQGRAAALEGRHTFGGAEIRYAGWSYSEDFLDLTAGSKAAPIYRSDTIPEVDFVYRSKRRGQSGLIMKTIVDLSPSFRWSNSLLAAGFSAGHDRQEFSSNLSYGVNKTTELMASYFTRRRCNSDRADPVLQRRYRLEGQFRVRRCDLRCYIGFSRESAGDQFASIFAAATFRGSEYCSWQLWSNWGEIDATGLRYWYLFVRGQWRMYKQVQLGAKLSNSYRRNRIEPNRAQLTLELTATI
jgi:hypothetical protein